MTIYQSPGRTYEVDVTGILADKAEFFTLGVSCPPCERSLKYEARALGIEDVPEAKAVIREGRRFTTLPAEDMKTFLGIRTKARQTFLSYSIYFPFIPPGVVAIRKDRIAAMWKEMNDHYIEFADAKAKLIDKLPTLKEARRADYKKAGESVWTKRQPKDATGAYIGFAAFMDTWEKVFERWFPTVYDIERAYKFDLKNAGRIEKTVSIMTRDEFLADEATSAKARIIADGERAIKAEFTDWIASVALNTRIQLFRALEPVVAGLRNGNSIGKRELAKIESHISSIRNMDVFGDAQFADMLAMVEKATAKLKADNGAMSKALAETKLYEALHKVEQSLTDVTFDPTSVRKLELDGDESESDVFADKEFMTQVTERMNAQIAGAVKELAEKAGGTPQEKADAEERMRVAMKIKAMAEDGANEATIDIAKRFLTLETDDAVAIGAAMEAAPEYDTSRFSNLELDDGSNTEPAANYVPVASALELD